MMFKTEFLKKYYNKQIEYDGVALYQCVDYVKKYLFDCYEIRPGSWGNAKDYFLQFDNPNWIGYKVMHKYFEKISGNVPPALGDIVVWNGTYGHIAISDGDSCPKWFYVYEQNWNSKKYVQRNKHFYTDVLGVLRPKFWTISAEEGLNVRTQANSNSRVIRTLPYKSYREFIPSNKSWKELKTGGFCYSKYLD